MSRGCVARNMRVLHSIAELAGVPGPVVIAVGVFDGVHLGHQTLIHLAREEADRLGGNAVVLTFDPHPARVLRPEKAPRLLTSTSHKIRLIEALGCEYLLIVTFDPIFAAKPPEDFVLELQSSARPLKMICVGHQWAFGKGRSGNVSLLREMGEKGGFTTLEIPPVEVGGAVVSSTLIRAAVEVADFERVANFLGRDYTILGTVVPGRELGRTLGFPTANLAAHNEQFPPDGVYAVRVLFEGKHHQGVANIGWKPTVTSGTERVLEIHLFDFGQDIYGRDLEVSFTKYLRPEQKFDSVELLKAQIAIDCEQARALLLS